MKTYLGEGYPAKPHRVDAFLVIYAALITMVLALVIVASAGACIGSNRKLSEAGVDKKLLSAEVRRLENQLAARASEIRRLENQLNGCAAELQIYRAGGTPE